MSNTRSRYGILVGLAAAAGAVCTAAMMSTATAPTARADDFTDIINAVDGDFATGQLDFTTAFSDFGSSAFGPGLTAFFDGVDDDLLSAPDNVIVGSVEALTNEPITNSITFGIGLPSSLADSVTLAESDFTGAESEFALAATDFSAGNYGDATLFDFIGADLASVVPVEELLLGAAVSF